MSERHDAMEDRLRSSLEARAGDVSPTPVLWEQVSARVRRRRWVARFATLGAAAAVLALVAVVGPMLWPTDDLPPILDEPDTPAVPADPGFLVTTDGQSIALLEEDGTRLGALVERDPGTAPIVSVAVRPGSTRSDLTLVYVTAGSPPTLHHLHYDGETVTAGEWPDHLGFTEPYAPATRPYPVWTPDGTHLAWVEFPWGQEDGGVSLRVIGWDEGPGTGDPATDNTTIGLDGIPLTSVRLDAWVWDDVAADGISAEGRLHLTSRELDAWVVTVERQGDGAIALPPDATLLVEGDGSVVVAAASGGGQVVYELEVRGTDEGGLAAEIVASGPAGPVARMPVPDELIDAADATEAGLSTIWMRAQRDTVVVGVDGRGWTVTRAGEVTELAGPIVHADLAGTRPSLTAPSAPDDDAPGDDADAPPDASGPPGMLVVTTGRDVVLVDTATGADQTVYTLPEEGEARVVTLAVRPGSTPDDLGIVVLAEAEGMYDLWYLRAADGSVTYDPVVHLGEVGDVVPAPAWSPDGRHVAWLTVTSNGAAMHVATSVAGGAAAGEAEFTIETYPVEDLDALGPGARLQAWDWQEGDGTARNGQLLVTSPATGGGSGTSLFAVVVQRRGDGTVEIDPRPMVEPDHGAAYVDVAPGAAPASRGLVYYLRAEGAGEGVVDFAITGVGQGGVDAELPFPEELTRTSDPTSVWMNAWGDAVVVGAGGRAWIVTRAGSSVELASVWYADWVR